MQTPTNKRMVKAGDIWMEVDAVHEAITSATLITRHPGNGPCSPPCPDDFLDINEFVEAKNIWAKRKGATEKESVHVAPIFERWQP